MMYKGTLFLIALVLIHQGETIKLNGNGYEDVIVYIGDNVKENDIDISIIQQWLTEASSKLYEASRYHVYLKNITIRIPPTWSTKASYQSVSGTGSKSSHIIIDDPNPLTGNTPYAYGQTSCGGEAQYIHFTPELLKQGNSGNFGNLGIVLVHEWGHLRWGLFDEYPSVKDFYGNLIQYYLHNGKWESVRCTLGISGVNRLRQSTNNCRLDNTGRPDKNCRFYPFRDQRATANASIMSHTFVPSVRHFVVNNFFGKTPLSFFTIHIAEIKQFRQKYMMTFSYLSCFNPTNELGITVDTGDPIYCELKEMCPFLGTYHLKIMHPHTKYRKNKWKDSKTYEPDKFTLFRLQVNQFCDKTGSEKHNSLAPNLQNFRCGGQSAWEVMREHPDFQDTNPGDKSIDTRPDFSFIQADGIDSICLVIDVSGSMASVIGLARSAAISLIKLLIPDGSYVSIVEFDTTARLLAPLTKLTSDKVRDDLVDTLPNRVLRSTGIGAGLLKALESFTSSDINNKTRGSIIYLTSDGEENVAPYIKDVLPTIIDSGVVVHALAIGRGADIKLGEISKATSGSSYFYSTDSTNSTALHDALSAPFVNSDRHEIVQIKSQHIVADKNEIYEDTFKVDSSIGNGTTIQYVAVQLEGVNLTVIDPSGNIYTVVGDHTSQGFLVVKLPGTAKIGEYKVILISHFNALEGTLGVQSKPSMTASPVVKIKAWTIGSNVTFYVSMKFLVYVSVMKGRLPISNADSTALIENERGETSTLTLKDNAVGADIIQGDGIYSGYITSSLITSNGRHSLKMLVKGYNSTVTTPVSKSIGFGEAEVEYREESLPKFERMAVAPEIIVENYTPITSLEDTIPPSPIQTLFLSEVDNDNNTYTVEWKAVGDDFDQGVASRYDIRKSKSHENLVSFFYEQEEVENIIVPKDPGQNEQLVISLPTTTANVTYFVGIRAVDDNNNTGELSNIVTLSVLADLTWIQGSNNETDKQELNMIVIGVIVAVTVAVVVIAVAIVLIIARRVRQTKNDKLNSVI